MKNVFFCFPFLFGMFFLISCQNNDSDKRLENEYLKITEYAHELERKQKTDSAFYYLNLIKQKFPNKLDWHVYAKLEQARLYQIICDFSESETITTEAMAINKNERYNYYLYNMLGTAYEEQLNYDKALQYYNLALKSTEDQLLRIILINNIAVAYLEQKRNEEVINILNPMINDDILQGENISYYAKIIDNLGFAYFKNNQKEKGYEYLNESLRIRDSIGDDYEKIASLVHLSRFHEESNPILAKEFAQKALQSATIVNSPDDKLEALALLTHMVDSSVSKKYFDDYIRINDSIHLIRQTAKNQFAKMKYDTSIEIEKNEKLTAQNNLITFLFLGFGIIAILIYFLIRSKNKREKLKIAYNTETRISKKLHDELANDVFNTMTFIETQDLQNATNKENVLQGLDAIYDKARNISKQTSEVKTGKEFGVVLNQLLMSYNSKQVTVIVKGSALVDWEKIKEDKQVAIHRTLSELLVNMKKYSQANLVLVTFETLEKTIKIQYKDDGIGFEKEKISKNGLLNVENRIHEINGSITFDTETNKGLKINIEFPK